MLLCVLQTTLHIKARQWTFACSSKLNFSKDSKSKSSQSDTSLNKSKDTSTPLRQQSRGRRRARNSGRSSVSSPSPIRAPDLQGSKKFRSNLEGDGDKVPFDKVIQSEHQEASDRVEQ